MADSSEDRDGGSGPVAGPQTGSRTERLAESPAVAALHTVGDDPGKAAALARQALAAARQAGDRGEESTALRALGLAARAAHDAPAAIAHLRRAVDVAARAGLKTRAAEARMSLALALDDMGETGKALRELDRAAAVLHGHAAARVQMQRSLLLEQLGRFDEALDGYRAALSTFRRVGDRLWEARTLTNRGVLHTYRGALRLAEADLRQAERLHRALGQRLAVAQVHHNLGFVAARAGDVPAALDWYDRAEAHFRTVGHHAVLLLDRCELLLSVRLLAEARAAATEAVAVLTSGRMAWYLAQARLLLAEIALAEGDRATAREAAAKARQAFARQRRPGWEALARYAALRARAGDAPDGRALAALRRVAADLEAAGWAVPALDARVVAAGLALTLGRHGVARTELGLAARARSRGPAELRARAWHAEALLRRHEGNTSGARRALGAGMRVLDAYRAALGATELRVHVSAHASDLALLGLRMAVEERRPAAVLDWTERWRAAVLRLPPARPPDDAGLAADLAELRRVAAELGDAARAGRPTAALARRERALEESVRRRTRHARGGLAVGQAAGAPGGAGGEAGGVPGGPVPPPSPAALRAALGGRALVELVELDGRLHAVVIAGGPPRLSDLGPVAEVRAELASLRFSLRRLALGHGGPASRAAAVAAAGHAAARLDQLLLAPLRPRLADRPLVLVPPGELHSLPWHLLPTCSGRPLTVAPSAAVWLRAATVPSAPSPVAGAGRQVLVAGPDLPHAAGEVAALAAMLPGAAALTGAAATADAALAALDGAALAHVAAHGAFRADNPLFSSLRLADGPVTVYDIERLGRAPRLLVLSACDSGLSGVRPGDELMGLAAALLALGTVTLVGSVGPVPDVATRPLMLAFHRHLLAGTPPASALVEAQAELLASAGGDGAELVTAASFVCFGAG